MDNVTHSLFGYALGRAVLGGRAERPRAAAWIASAVVASNGPNLDFALPLFARNRTLGYVLHHRGYTHTVVGALALGALLGLFCAVLTRVRGRDVQGAVLLGALAGLLHVVFDFFNNYGVHPFWPFDDRWRYGDAVFIVEPLLLTALWPLCALEPGLLPARVLGWSVGALLLVFEWALLPARVALGVSVAALLVLAQQRWHRGSAWPALVSAACVVATFFACSALARSRLEAELGRQRPTERLVQLATAPLPGNPLWWSAVAVSADATDYHVRLAEQTLLPTWLALPRRWPFAPSATTAHLRPPSVASTTPGLRFTAEFRAPLAELRALYRSDCEASAMLGFLRAPYFQREGERIVLGDLRYDNEPGLGFAEIALSGAADACPRWLPPWVPPVAMLLR